MTREEAIFYIKELQKAHASMDKKVAEAVDMAIEALSKPNYESDNEVRLAVTDRNKDKVVLWDAFGEQEYYPTTHGRLIDADALYASIAKDTYLLTDRINSRDYGMFLVGIKKKIDNAPTVQADRPHGEWMSRIDTGTWMLECSACGCRVQEEPYRIAVGENATRCPYCGAELGLGGYLYDEYADRPSQRGGGDNGKD